MPAHKWELRADVRPLDEAAGRWSEMGDLMAQRADDLVQAARHAVDGWDAAAADSYDEHRRQVIANLDHFTTLAAQVAGSLRALSSMITIGQQELDRAWTEVSLVPHRVIGPDRRLVFREEDDDDRAKVARCEIAADEIRRRLAGSLDQESTRLRTARADLRLVRASLVELAGGAFPALLRPGVEKSGAGVLGPVSTSVRGTAESGAGVVAVPVGPLPVSMPTLSGVAVTGLAPVIGVTASGTAGRRGDTTSRPPGGGIPPMGGGMAAGAMRGGSALRGGAAGRRTGGGTGSLVTPRQSGADESARVAREKQAAKHAEREAKRAELAEKRAARAARRAGRQAGREAERQAERDEPAVPPDAAAAAAALSAGLTVVDVAPGERQTDSRL